MLKCEHCKQLIEFGNALIHEGMIFHNEPEYNNCASHYLMTHQGYPVPCPPCKSTGKTKFGFDDIDCHLCLGRGFLVKAPVQNEHGVWKKVK